MYNLAHMYYSGTGTVKNLKLAYKMFLNAKISGINESNYFINKITQEITPQELIVLTEEYSSLINLKEKKKKTFFKNVMGFSGV